jgi:hypothetical protein
MLDELTTTSESWQQYQNMKRLDSEKERTSQVTVNKLPSTTKEIQGGGEDFIAGLEYYLSC